MTINLIMFVLLTPQGGWTLVHPLFSNFESPPFHDRILFVGCASFCDLGCLSGEGAGNVIQSAYPVPGWIQKYLTWQLTCLMQRFKNIWKPLNDSDRVVTGKKGKIPDQEGIGHSTDEVGSGYRSRDLWHLRQPGFDGPMKSMVNDWPKHWGLS